MTGVSITMTTKAVDVELLLDNDNGTFHASAFSRQALSRECSFAAVFDHTLLKPDATREQVVRLCEEAAQHGFACAMVNPTWVSTAFTTLAGSGIPVGTVLGFPLGASL